MTRTKNTFLAVVAVLLSPMAANADTIDVSEITDATLNVQNLSNVTLTSFGTNGFFVGSGGFCAFAADFSCEEDMQIDFLSAVENLFLSSFGVTDVLDSVTISAFLGGSLLGQITVTTTGTFDLSGFGALDRLFFDDNSTAAGIGWNNFEFDTVASVPEPGTLALLGIGLLGMGAARGRKKA